MLGARGARQEIAKLREDNADLRNRIRKIEQPGDLQYLFMMTYGRSGSTLLNAILNTIPGYTIRGENRDALHHLYTFQQTMLKEKKQQGGRSREVGHPWYGAGDFPPKRSISGIRNLALETVLRPKPDTRVSGFKEVRWYGRDLDAYVAWMRDVFPGARFLVNTRNQADVLKSKWWAEGDDKSEHLAKIEERILEVAATLGDDAYHVHYDDYVADPLVLRGLFEWLGEPFDEEAVRAAMAVRYSS